VVLPTVALSDSHLISCRVCVCVCDPDAQNMCEDMKNYGVATSPNTKEPGWMQIQVGERNYERNKHKQKSKPERIVKVVTSSNTRVLWFLFNLHPCV
jgi:hypothetical protein